MERWDGMGVGFESGLSLEEIIGRQVRSTACACAHTSGAKEVLPLNTQLRALVEAPCCKCALT